MPTGSDGDVDDLPDRYRFRKGWSGTTRLAASQTLRAAMSAHDGLIAVSEAAAEALMEIFVANAASITLMDRVEYRDLVNVGKLDPDMVRFPEGPRYPTSSYPAATRRLLELEGYISTDTELDVVREYLEQSPYDRPGCFMGVPIVADGEVRGEVFFLRVPDLPSYTAEDLEVAYDLATQFGAQLPALLAAHAELHPDW